MEKFESSSSLKKKLIFIYTSLKICFTVHRLILQFSVVTNFSAEKVFVKYIESELENV